MKRHLPKKATDRPKKLPKQSRIKAAAVETKVAIQDEIPAKKKRPSGAQGDPLPSLIKAPSPKAHQLCLNCSEDLATKDKALFVEEEIGRIFCSETCIAKYFGPEIKKLEKEYFKKLSPADFTGDERESLSHLRWLTLQEPDEVWKETMPSGDHRFTLISEFKPSKKKVWCVCITLFLRGEPSFLYLAFPTRNAAMANFYRKGEKVDFHAMKIAHSPGSEGITEKSMLIDGLAGEWTEEETLRAQLAKDRTLDDIPPHEFNLYQAYLEETLETPDEVWSNQAKGPESLRLFHFLKHYPNEPSGVWYIIIAREVEDEEQIEIVDAFPTRDPNLADQFRRGTQEVGAPTAVATQRVVH